MNKRIAKRLRSTVTHRALGTLAPKYVDGNRLGLRRRLEMAGLVGLEKHFGKQIEKVILGAKDAAPQSPIGAK